MKIVYPYLYLLLAALSLFILSTGFATPSEPALYVAIMGSSLWAMVGLMLNYRQCSLNVSVVEVLLGIGILYVEFCSFYNGTSPINLLWGGSLVVFYAFSRRIPINVLWLSLGVSLLGLAQAIYGIGQYFYWYPNIAARSFRISGSFDNPAGFAAALVACFPFALQIIREPRWYFRLPGIVSAGVIALGIVLAQSRAGIMAAGFIVAVWLFSGLPEKWKVWLKRKTVIGFVAVMAVLLLGSLYYWKKDSANGRLLIWKCSARMIADKPMLGHGVGGFQREYMLYQVAYFRSHPDSKYVMLADIVKHPFNEYLLLGVEQGLVGLFLWGTIIWLLIRHCRRNKDKTENRAYMLCLLSIAVFACFSYPLNYPFVRLMAVFSAAMITRKEPRLFQLKSLGVRVLKPLALVVLLGMIALTGKMFYNEYHWNTIARRSLAGETRKVLPEYAQLYPWMHSEGLFLYNYAAELNYIGEWRKSNRLMKECSRIYNDNDVQLILADNCQQQKQYAQAEQHLKLAYEMIPNRFIPLYRLVQLYQLQGRNADARKLAKQIIDKPVKIPSFDIMTIKNEMVELINQKRKTKNS
jgi:O-antigen ligase